MFSVEKLSRVFKHHINETFHISYGNFKSSVKMVESLQKKRYFNGHRGTIFAVKQSQSSTKETQGKKCDKFTLIVGKNKPCFLKGKRAAFTASHQRNIPCIS